MGSLIGHVLPGLGFLLIGLWHLFNHTKLHSQDPKSYVSRLWFPSRWLKHLELYLIMSGAALSVAMELFVGPDLHHPLARDGTIPAYHLQNFEHSSISVSFFVYASLSLVLDRLTPSPPAAYALAHLLGAAALSQELLLFRLHSADHVGVEGQYHALLQLLIGVSLTTTILGVRLRASFSASFVRSLSIMFQGVWLVMMGCALWTPRLVPKGCFIKMEAGHKVVGCTDAAALHRAKSLVNILFSWTFIAVVVFAFWFYLAVVNAYGDKFEYRSLAAAPKDTPKADDVESEKKGGALLESNALIHTMQKGFAAINMER